MKRFLLSLAMACLLCAAACMAQDRQPALAFSGTAGTDFEGPLNALGFEVGLYSANRAHSVMLTMQQESMSNAHLIAYGRENKAFPELSGSREAYTVGVKYTVKVVAFGPFYASAVVHPWYSWNMSIASACIGGRFSFNHKGDIIGAELMHDPFAGRYTLRLVFTTFQLKRDR